jgi:hypothetical protein
MPVLPVLLTIIYTLLITGMDNKEDPLDDYMDSDPEREIPREQVDKLLGGEDESPMDTDQQPSGSGKQAVSDSNAQAKPGPDAARTSSNVVPRTVSGYNPQLPPLLLQSTCQRHILISKRLETANVPYAPLTVAQ